MTSVVTSQRAVHSSKLFGETQFGLLPHMFADSRHNNKDRMDLHHIESFIHFKILLNVKLIIG